MKKKLSKEIQLGASSKGREESNEGWDIMINSRHKNRDPETKETDIKVY